MQIQGNTRRRHNMPHQLILAMDPLSLFLHIQMEEVGLGSLHIICSIVILHTDKAITKGKVLCRVNISRINKASLTTVGSLVLGLKATTMGPRRELAGISVIFNGLHQVLEVRVAKTAPSQHQHNSPRVLHPPPQPMSGCLLISEKAIILSDL